MQRRYKNIFKINYKMIIRRKEAFAGRPVGRMYLADRAMLKNEVTENYTTGCRDF